MIRTEAWLCCHSDYRVILLYILYPTLDAILNCTYAPNVSNSSSKAAKLICSINESMKRAIGREMVAYENQHSAMPDIFNSVISYLPYYLIWVAITNAKNDFTARAVLQTILQAPSQLQRSSVQSQALAGWVAGLCLPYGSSLLTLRSYGSVTNSMEIFLEIAAPVESSSVVLQAIIENSERLHLLKQLCDSYLKNLREFMVTEDAWRKDAPHACSSFKQELNIFIEKMAHSAGDPNTSYK